MAPLRDRPLLIVHTGDMKGKSTAAFGLALRIWAAGLPLGVYQFIKGDTWRSGEKTAFRALSQIHAETGEGAPVTWHTLGEGRSRARQTTTDPTPADNSDRAATAMAGWKLVQADLAAHRHGCYLLDEFTYPLAWGWVDVAEVIETFRDRPGFQHVIVTGRAADQRLIAAADLVVEMTKIKHPFDHGYRGQRGIEW